MADQLDANAQKTLNAFIKEYGQQTGTQRFWAMINEHRRHRPGDKLLRALGAQTDLGAASGGRGHEHAKAKPFRATDAPKTVKTRHPTQFKRPGK